MLAPKKRVRDQVIHLYHLNMQTPYEEHRVETGTEKDRIEQNIIG